MQLDDVLTTRDAAARACVSAAAIPADPQLAQFRHTMEDFVCARTLQFHKDIDTGVRRWADLDDFAAWARILCEPIDVPGDQGPYIMPITMYEDEIDYQVEITRDNVAARDCGLRYFPSHVSVGREVVDRLETTFRKIFDAGGSPSGVHRVMLLQVAAYREPSSPGMERPMARVALMERDYRGTTCSVRTRPFYLEYRYQPDKDTDQARSLERYLAYGACEDIRRASGYFLAE